MSSNNSLKITRFYGDKDKKDKQAELKKAELDARKDYMASLSDLKGNSKPLINTLSIVAGEYRKFGKTITETIENHLLKAPATHKLPCLYLVDSIIKNVGAPYIEHISKCVVRMFTNTFTEGDESVRKSLFKLRLTWKDIFTVNKLRDLDACIHEIDPNWPKIHEAESTPSTVHINPNFLKKPAAATTSEVEELLRIRKEKAALERAQREFEEKKKQFERLQLQLQLQQQKERMLNENRASVSEELGGIVKGVPSNKPAVTIATVSRDHAVTIATVSRDRAALSPSKPKDKRKLEKAPKHEDMQPPPTTTTKPTKRTARKSIANSPSTVPQKISRVGRIPKLSAEEKVKSGDKKRPRQSDSEGSETDKQKPKRVYPLRNRSTGDEPRNSKSKDGSGSDMSMDSDGEPPAPPLSLLPTLHPSIPPSLPPSIPPSSVAPEHKPQIPVATVIPAPVVIPVRPPPPVHYMRHAGKMPGPDSTFHAPSPEKQYVRPPPPAMIPPRPPAPEAAPPRPPPPQEIPARPPAPSVRPLPPPLSAPIRLDKDSGKGKIKIIVPLKLPGDPDEPVSGPTKPPPGPTPAPIRPSFEDRQTSDPRYNEPRDRRDEIRDYRASPERHYRAQPPLRDDYRAQPPLRDDSRAQPPLRDDSPPLRDDYPPRDNFPGQRGNFSGPRDDRRPDFTPLRDMRRDPPLRDDLDRRREQEDLDRRREQEDVERRREQEDWRCDERRVEDRRGPPPPAHDNLERRRDPAPPPRDVIDRRPVRGGPRDTVRGGPRDTGRGGPRDTGRGGPRDPPPPPQDTERKYYGVRIGDVAAVPQNDLPEIVMFNSDAPKERPHDDFTIDRKPERRVADEVGFEDRRPTRGRGSYVSVPGWDNDGVGRGCENSYRGRGRGAGNFPAKPDNLPHRYLVKADYTPAQFNRLHRVALDDFEQEKIAKEEFQALRDDIRYYFPNFRFVVSSTSSVSSSSRYRGSFRGVPRGGPRDRTFDQGPGPREPGPPGVSGPPPPPGPPVVSGPPPPPRPRLPVIKLQVHVKKPEPVKPLDPASLFDQLLKTGLVVTKLPFKLSFNYIINLNKETLIDSLYTGAPCTNCGKRFDGEEVKSFNVHLDWHFRVNIQSKTGQIARQWYMMKDDWGTVPSHAGSLDNQHNQPVNSNFPDTWHTPLDDFCGLKRCLLRSGDEDYCHVCHDRLQQEFNQREDDWYFINAHRRTEDEKVCHVHCIQEGVEEGNVTAGLEVTMNESIVDSVDSVDSGSRSRLESQDLSSPVPPQLCVNKEKEAAMLVLLEKAKTALVGNKTPPPPSPPPAPPASVAPAAEHVPLQTPATQDEEESDVIGKEPTKREVPGKEPTKREVPGKEPTKREVPGKEPTKREVPGTEPTEKTPASDTVLQEVPGTQPTANDSVLQEDIQKEVEEAILALK